MRLPDGGRVLGEDVLEVAVALHAARREVGDVEVAGPLVLVLDEQPAAIAAAARADGRGPRRAVWARLSRQRPLFLGRYDCPHAP